MVSCKLVNFYDGNLALPVNITPARFLVIPTPTIYPSYILICMKCMKQCMCKVIHCAIVYESNGRMSIPTRLPSRYFQNEADIYVQT